MNELTDGQIDAVWHFMDPDGYGRSRYDISRRLIAAHLELQDAEIEQLRADAARYRWLRDPCSGAENAVMYGRGDYGRGLMSGAMLDDAIDTEMKEQHE